MKLAAKELRVSQPTRSDLVKIKRREIYIICDNVLDTYNIGSIFRLADAVAAKCIYLCGQSETPPNSRIAKASIGTDKWVPWQYASTAVEAIENLRKSGAIKAAKRAGKIAAEGLVLSYIHGVGKIGVLVEVNCETDFVGKTDAFRALVNDVAMQIAGANPKYLSREDVPAEELEKRLGETGKK